MYGSAEEMHAVPVQLDAHGGHRLPDGTVSYVHSAGFQQQPSAAAYQGQQGSYPPPQNYNYEPHGPPGAPNGPSHEEKEKTTEEEGQAAGKEANLPPPEVARMIPCRFFPNCRYGEKCIFAHPVAVPVGNGPEGATSPQPSNVAAGDSTSPVANNNVAAAPVFYQPPPGYGYGQAPPYGPPQHFYLGPPMPIQYSHAGVPLPLHFPPPPHSHGHPDAGPNESFSPQAQFATSPPSHHFQPHPPQHVMHPQQFFPQSQQQVAAVGPNGEIADQNQNQSRQEKSGEAGKEDGGEGNDGNQKNENSTTTTTSSSTNGRSSHRRQSFNSFLHHHAIPFQPTSNLGLGSITGNPIEGGRTSTGYRGKRGRGGNNGFNGNYNGRPYRSSSERPPCTFFLKGGCNYGEECAFPHYLADGTDARTPAAIAGETAPHKKNPFYANGNGATNGHSNGINGSSSRGTRGGRGRGSSHNHTGSLTHPLPSGPAASNLPTSNAFPNASATPVVPQEKKEDNSSSTAAEPSSNLPVVETSSSSNQTVTETEAPKQQVNEKVGSTTMTATTTKSTIPTPQQAASIPPKPVEALNSLKENQEKKENKENSTPATTGSNSKQSNNSNSTGSEKKANNNSNNKSTSSSAATSGVPAKPRANGSGRSNHNNNNNHNSSNQNSTARKVAAPSQRVPNGDDFPALGGVGKDHSTSNGVSNSSSSTSNSSDSTAVNPTPQPPKINFSAVLSAPAPVKEVAPTTTNNEEKNVQVEKEKKEKKEKKQVNGHHAQHHHVNATSPPPPPPSAPKKFAPQVDEDGFSIVGAKHGSKHNNNNSSATAANQDQNQNQNGGASFAGVAPSNTVAA